MYLVPQLCKIAVFYLEYHKNKAEKNDFLGVTVLLLQIRLITFWLGVQHFYEHVMQETNVSLNSKGCVKQRPIRDVD